MTYPRESPRSTFAIIYYLIVGLDGVYIRHNTYIFGNDHDIIYIILLYLFHYTYFLSFNLFILFTKNPWWQYQHVGHILITACFLIFFIFIQISSYFDAIFLSLPIMLILIYQIKKNNCPAKNETRQNGE